MHFLARVPIPLSSSLSSPSSIQERQLRRGVFFTLLVFHLPPPCLTRVIIAFVVASSPPQCDSSWLTSQVSQSVSELVIFSQSVSQSVIHSVSQSVSQLVSQLISYQFN
ncbi:hypothetical protein E2C01_097427 [Portunus trituberculatus]|uniref:Uncharacterized protein n=1 Tax=Portunus trituberculatus TaxID=210409 RepID=A0A5B7K9W8_PORTR|nr:hypothetical protein [Portunus trituberculatus]